MTLRLVLFLLIFGSAASVQAEPLKIKVFVALCDNKTQSIVPVGAKIGNGDDAPSNLYWGCSDGLYAYFRKSDRWKTVESTKDVSDAILHRLEMSHAAADIQLVADAYRGSEMAQCIQDFEAACASNDYDLVAFIGHNGLMDFEIPLPKAVEGNDTDVAVLCCVSDSYFSDRLSSLGCRPILMTRQLMYPGAFILHDAIESWRRDGSLSEIRSAAGKAYAKNQKISVKAATGVFADLSTD